MKIIDLCSGLGGASSAFKERGHEVFTVDILKKYNPSLRKDVRAVLPDEMPRDPAFIWASPPCTGFSLQSAAKHWKDGRPATRTAKRGVQIAAACLRLIIALRPPWWILENPTGMMRRVLGKPDYRTWGGAWGMPILKPTDLWGKLPDGMVWKPEPEGPFLDFDRWKVRKFVKAKIPFELSLAICKAIEMECEHTCENPN